MTRQRASVRTITIGALLITAALTGCLGSTDDDEDLAAADVGATPELNIQDVPFEEEGTFPLYTVVTCGIFGCLQLNDRGAFIFDAPTEGTVQDVELTMTWDATTPVMAQLGMTLAWNCQGGGPCDTESAFGASPLELSVDDIEEADAVYVLAWAPHRGAEQANLRVSHAQDFQIDGTFTTLVSDQADDEPEDSA